MTEHTPKQIALAERIAWIVVPRSSPDWQVAFDASLAAIVEVSELAAKMIDNHYDSGDRDTHYERQIAQTLRNGDHLK